MPMNGGENYDAKIVSTEKKKKKKIAGQDYTNLEQMNLIPEHEMEEK